MDTLQMASSIAWAVVGLTNAISVLVLFTVGVFMKEDLVLKNGEEGQ